MFANPSDFSIAHLTCGRCHTRLLEQTKNSPMATAIKNINYTRFLWGAQERPEPRYATKSVSSYKELPKFSESRALVDDLLRRKCLRCHLNSPGALQYGSYRAGGCAACHMIYADDGLSRDEDRAVQKVMEEIKKGKRPQSRGYPEKHSFTRSIPTSQCLHCHHGGHVGTDYVGLTERDTSEDYRFLSPDGFSFRPLYGTDYRAMTPDIHFEKGIACIDCHGPREVMGKGVSIRCESCHGTPDAFPQTLKTPLGRTLMEPGGNPLQNTRMEDNQAFLKERGTGKIHRIPLLKTNPNPPVNHQIPEHIRKMECHACHALWTYQDYGLHLLRLDIPDYDPWVPLFAQPDPQVQEALSKGLKLSSNKRPAPTSRDWLSGMGCG